MSFQNIKKTSLQNTSANSSPSIKIFVCHTPNKNTKMFDSTDTHVNIIAGADYDESFDPDLIRDNIGDNISVKNKAYCEQSVQYWMWKNVDADYYGLCHYRRYFSFNIRKLQTESHGYIPYQYLDKKAIEELCILDDDKVRCEVEGTDIILTEPDDLSKHGVDSIYAQYDSGAPIHKLKDLETAMSIVCKKYPEMSAVVKEYMNGSIFYPCNMFIMRKEVFFNYCEFLFDILYELENQLDMSKYNREQYRCISYISERLLGIYSIWAKKKYGYSVKTLQRAFIWNCENYFPPKPFFAENNIPIVTLCSELFAPIFGVLLRSLIMNGNRNNNYDVNILYDDMCNETQARLVKSVESYPNIKIRFFNIGQYKLLLNAYANMGVSPVSWYRFFAPEIFIAYEKIVWLDSDTLVKKDIAEFYHIDIGNSLASGVQDVDVIGGLNGYLPHIKDYFFAHFDDPYQYIQAGVMVWNIDEINKRDMQKKLISVANSQKFIFGDQDVINILFQGNTVLCDMRWNVFANNKGRRQKVVNFAPLSVADNYAKARKDPFVIHFAGDIKPWLDITEDFAEDWWAVARLTPFYDVLLSRLFERETHAESISHNRTNDGSVSKWDSYRQKHPEGSRSRRLIRMLFPPNSLRKRLASKLYFGR